MSSTLTIFKSSYSAPRVRLLFSVFSLGLLLCIAGCQSLTAQQRNQLANLRYPSDAKNISNKDIVVVRDGDEINLVNRTPDVYKNMQLWLNKNYVHVVKKIAIGTNGNLDLSAFINRYRKSFPVGQFLAPDKADDLVLAELYNPRTKQMYRLFVLDPLKIDNAARSRGQKLEDIR